MTTYVCPSCSSPIDGHTNVVDDAKPRIGDLSICLHCAGLAWFAEDGLRATSEAEREWLLRQTTVVRTVAAVMEFHADRETS